MFALQERIGSLTVNVMNFDSPYYDEVSDAVRFAEETFDICCCFAGITASAGYGFDNGTGDLDIKVIYQNPSGRENTHRRIIDFENSGARYKKTDLRVIDLGFFDNLRFEDNLEGYPYAPEIIIPNKRFAYDILPGHRNCKLKAFFTELFFCNKVWDDQRYIEKNKARLEGNLTVYDYLKHQFVLAHGRLNHYMREGQVRYRSYLYTSREIFALEYLLDNDMLPPLDYGALLDSVAAGMDIKDLLLEIYKKNKLPVPKNQMLTAPIIKLNTFFDAKLGELKPGIARYFSTGTDKTFQLDVVY